MRLYQLTVLQINDGNARSLSTTSDLSSFSFYQRGSVGEFMTFMAKTVTERTSAGQRQSVQENTYTAHCYNPGLAENIAAVVIADAEYPVRPAFSLLQKVIDDFISQVPATSYDRPDFPAINTYLQKYQDPKNADQIMRVQAELDETKIILHKTIEGVLQRGENLENLVQRSTDLSNQSKAFYKTARKQNSCCVVM